MIITLSLHICFGKNVCKHFPKNGDIKSWDEWKEEKDLQSQFFNNTQHSFLTRPEKCRNKLDKGKFIGVMFRNFLKAFDLMKDNLLVAKLEAYGFSRISLQLMKVYLKNYKQRANINRMGNNYYWFSARLLSRLLVT